MRCGRRGPGSGSAVVVQPPLDVGTPEVSASASPTVLHLGNRFTLFVTAAYDPGVEVNLREPVELGPAFEVRHKNVRDDVRPDGKHVREWQLDVLVWDLGDLRVPPVAVTFTFGGKAGQVDTNSVPLRVENMLGDADDPKAMRALAPPTDLTSRDWFWLLVGAGIGGALGAAIALLVWRRHRRAITQLTGGTMARLDTPGERALARLLQLEKSGILERDPERKGGYGAMVDVIRDYVGARYRVATRDLTIARAVSPARRRRAGGRARGGRGVARALGDIDQVRGRARASVWDARGVLGEARKLVLNGPRREGAVIRETGRQFRSAPVAGCPFPVSGSLLEHVR